MTHCLLGLFNAASLWLLITRRDRAVGWGWIGLLQGLAVATRIGCIPSALVFMAASFLSPVPDRAERWRRLRFFPLGAAPALIFLGAYNSVYFGHPLRTAFGSKPAGMILLPFEGTAGLLVSPCKGLLLFSPILLLAFWGLLKNVRGRIEVKVAAAAFVAHLLYWGSYLDWGGGYCWGPRYMAEAIPFIVLITAIALDTLLSQRKPWVAPLAGALAVLSLGFQLIGMFSWDRTYQMKYAPGFDTQAQPRYWAWKAPFEPYWLMRYGKLYVPRLHQGETKPK